MYSSTLFIVQWSLYGLIGSQATPTSIVRKRREQELIGNPAGKIHIVLQAQSIPLSQEVRPLGPGTHQQELHVFPADGGERCAPRRRSSNSLRRHCP